MSEAIDLSNMHWMPKREKVIHLAKILWEYTVLITDINTIVYKAVSTNVVPHKSILNVQLILWVAKVWYCSIQVHISSASKKDESMYEVYMCLCCFLLLHWNTLSFNQATMKHHYP